jgi:hypothetical protein
LPTERTEVSPARSKSLQIAPNRFKSLQEDHTDDGLVEW